MSWECCKVIDYCKEKGDVNSSNHKCLVKWNDINRTKSWVNCFVLSLSYPKPIISFARNNNLLDKMPFCHLTQYCRSNMSVDIARILKVSTRTAGIKYNFGIQVPKGIKNATSYPDHSLYPVEDHSNWMEFYPHASEEIPKDLPPEK
jgi:hypothetical protein